LESPGGRFVEVTLPGRLTAHQEQQRAIASCIATALGGGTAHAVEAICTVEIRQFTLQDSPFSAAGHQLTMGDVDEFARRNFGVEYAHLLAGWSPRHAAVVLRFSSRKPDRVLAELYKHLKDDAKRQFSGHRPALLCVHLADLTEPQLLELAEADQIGEGTGIQ